MSDRCDTQIINTHIINIASQLYSYNLLVLQVRIPCYPQDRTKPNQPELNRSSNLRNAVVRSQRALLVVSWRETQQGTVGKTYGTSGIIHTLNLWYRSAKIRLRSGNYFGPVTSRIRSGNNRLHSGTILFVQGTIPFVQGTNPLRSENNRLRSGNNPLRSGNNRLRSGNYRLRSGNYLLHSGNNRLCSGNNREIRSNR